MIGIKGEDVLDVSFAREHAGHVVSERDFVVIVASELLTRPVEVCPVGVNDRCRRLPDSVESRGRALVIVATQDERRQLVEYVGRRVEWAVGRRAGSDRLEDRCCTLVSLCCLDEARIESAGIDEKRGRSGVAGIRHPSALAVEGVIDLGFIDRIVGR